MKPINENACSICSEVFWASERKIRVDEKVLQLLKFLFTKVNCSALQNTQICGGCLENVRNANNFKMLYVKKKTLNVVSEIEQIDLEISCICQICKEIIKKSSSTSYTKDLKLVIHQLIDGIRTGLETTEDSRICVSCQESVANFHSVIKLLSNFDEEHTSNIKSEDDSFSIENIKAESSIEYSNISNENSIVQIEPMQIDIKQEVKQDSEISLRYEDFIGKIEEFDMKAEHENKSLDIQNTIIIKEVKYSDVTNKQIEPMQIDIKMELQQDNEINLTYEDFIGKNEHVDVKSEHEESNFTEQKWDVSGEHTTMDPLILAKQILQSCMLQHKNIDENKMYSCDICTHKTKRKSNLKTHLLIHKNADEIKMFACDVCGYKAKQKTHLKTHSLKHKSVDEIKMFACDICSYTSKYKSGLKMHTLLHKNVDEIRMFTCDICGYKTKRNEHLQIHMLKHKNADEVEMFNCDICSYTTKLKGNLKTHTLKHKNIDEIKMFKCDICSHITKHKSSLKTHMLVHEDVDEIKMIKCDICSYTTPRIVNFKRHMLRHKNMK